MRSMVLVKLAGQLLKQMKTLAGCQGPAAEACQHLRRVLDPECWAGAVARACKHFALGLCIVDDFTMAQLQLLR